MQFYVYSSSVRVNLPPVTLSLSSQKCIGNLLLTMDFVTKINNTAKQANKETKRNSFQVREV